MQFNSETASLNETAAKLETVLKDSTPLFEIRQKAELVYEINRLKAEQDAIVLGHNYMEPALYHFVADVRGDSLELCRKAAVTEASTIVFLGVEFMAETAKILNPGKRVLIPSREAGCSLASSITGDDLRKLRETYPGVPIVSYINTYAEVKAETDVCCTSGNAAKIISSLNSPRIIFVPDEFLARNISRETGKEIIFPEQDLHGTSNAPLIGWHGKCEVHEKFTLEDISSVRQQFPDVVILAHPECPPELTATANFSGSTSAMLKYIEANQNQRYLLLTECAMGDNIVASYPNINILRLCSFRCPHMAKITLQDTLDSFRKSQFEIDVPEAIRIKAKRSIDRMLELS